MKFRHACILAVATALGLVGGGQTAWALRATPAFQARDAKKPLTAARSAPSTATRELNRFQKDRLANFTSRGARLAASDDTLRVAVFQVQFTDTLMGGQPGSKRSLRDTAWFNNELTHMDQYYRGASRQHFHMQATLDTTLYTLSKKMSYYGGDANEETRVVELATEVVNLVDNTVDFSQFDHVFIIHAGAGQETDIGGDSPNQIWSSFYDRSDIRRAQKEPASSGIATNDGLFIDNFSIVPSDASQDFATIGTLGIWAFQIGSRIGLVPLFDSTGGPDSEGIGNFDIMSYGLFDVNGFVPSFPCAFNRALMGWVSPVVIDAGSEQIVNLKDINTGSDTDTLCLKIPITENEYFLVDNREHDANADSLFTFTDNDSDLVPDNTDSLDGAEFDFFLTDLTNPAIRGFDPRYGFDVLYRHTGSGMYVWHVDEQVIRDAVVQGYLPDDFVARKGVDLEEADGVQDMDAPGNAAFSLGSYFDSFRREPKAHFMFHDETKPNSASNSGAHTGIYIATSSPAQPSMRVSVMRANTNYGDKRVRWDAASPGQCATPVDLDGDGTTEIVVLSDSAGVFVFKDDGTEWNDADANPSTITPYISVPGIVWAGPPAFVSWEASSTEIIAAAKTGELYAWRPNGTEFVDGDANPGTQGILHKGAPIIAPPMILDVNGGLLDVVIAEQQPSTVRLSFIDATGAMVIPTSPLISTQWPHAIPGQRVAPLAEMHIKDGATTVIGVAVASVDTTASRMSFTWVPAAFNGAAPAVAPVVHTTGIGGASTLAYLPSAPAVGDMDGDGSDEAVVTTPSGAVYVIDFASATSDVVNLESDHLRAANPSAPALGDVDGDGTLEIAVWDDAYTYLLKSNARPLVNWPRAIHPESSGEVPPISIARAFESPLVVSLHNGSNDVLFPLDDGTLLALDARGAGISDFPRVIPSGAGAAPALMPNVGIVFLGSAGRVQSVNSIVDSVGVASQSVLSIQSVLGGNGSPYWPMWRGDLARSGRIARTPSTVAAKSAAFDKSSFIIYPNPVKEGTVHARVDTNARATVALSVLTLEGQEAITRSFTVNPNGLPNTPFDEVIDVGALKSGVYLMRLRIESSAGSGSLVKTFAIRR